MVETSNHSPDKRLKISTGDAADIIAVAQRLIRIGVINNDPKIIENGMQRWKEVWPDEVVDSVTAALIEDIRKESI